MTSPKARRLAISRRLFKRPVTAAPLGDDDIQFLWAEYSAHGLWNLEHGLTPPVFTDRVIDYVNGLLGVKGDVYLIQQDGPVGLVEQIPTFRRAYHMSFAWFSDASARQKLEAMAQLTTLANTIPITLDSQNDTREQNYHAKLCQYGILRPIGLIEGAGDDGENVVLYQAMQQDEDGYSWWPM